MSIVYSLISALPNTTPPTSNYLGTWDASTNTPTLADGTGNVGDYYEISIAGTQNLGSGFQIFPIGSLVICTSSNQWKLKTQPPAQWGTIIGTLSNQIDLQSVLDSKLNTSSTIDGGTF